MVNQDMTTEQAIREFLVTFGIRHFQLETGQRRRIFIADTDRISFHVVSDSPEYIAIARLWKIAHEAVEAEKDTP